MNLETRTSPNVKEAVPLFRVSNMDESVRYSRTQEQETAPV